jgi:FAD/FMN-containing dehydrogenase
LKSPDIPHFKAELEAKLGKTKVSDKIELLEFFSMDDSINPKKLPLLVLSPTTIQEIQEILTIANKYKISIIPSSSTEKYYGATIPQDNSIILDLRTMNQILEIEQDERYVRVEAGVTYKQLQSELKKLGLRIMVPLGLLDQKSCYLKDGNVS